MAGYRLSDMALEDVAAIYDYSVTNWGERRADEYVAAIYSAFEALAGIPDRPTPRHVRSAPFRMAAVESHFIVYDLAESGVVILTILHQAQDVERRIARLTPVFRHLIA